MSDTDPQVAPLRVIEGGSADFTPEVVAFAKIFEESWARPRGFSVARALAVSDSDDPFKPKSSTVEEQQRRHSFDEQRGRQQRQDNGHGRSMYHIASDHGQYHHHHLLKEFEKDVERGLDALRGKHRRLSNQRHKWQEKDEEQNSDPEPEHPKPSRPDDSLEQSSSEGELTPASSSVPDASSSEAESDFAQSDAPHASEQSRFKPLPASAISQRNSTPSASALPSTDPQLLPPLTPGEASRQTLPLQQTLPANPIPPASLINVAAFAPQFRQQLQLSPPMQQMPSFQPNIGAMQGISTFTLAGQPGAQYLVPSPQNQPQVIQPQAFQAYVQPMVVSSAVPSTPQSVDPRFAPMPPSAGQQAPGRLEATRSIRGASSIAQQASQAIPPPPPSMRATASSAQPSNVVQAGSPSLYRPNARTPALVSSPRAPAPLAVPVSVMQPTYQSQQASRQYSIPQQRQAAVSLSNQAPPPAILTSTTTGARARIAQPDLSLSAVPTPTSWSSTSASIRNMPPSNGTSRFSDPSQAPSGPDPTLPATSSSTSADMIANQRLAPAARLSARSAVGSLGSDSPESDSELHTTPQGSSDDSNMQAPPSARSKRRSNITPAASSSVSGTESGSDLDQVQKPSIRTKAHRHHHHHHHVHSRHQSPAVVSPPSSRRDEQSGYQNSIDSSSGDIDDRSQMPERRRPSRADTEISISKDETLDSDVGEAEPTSFDGPVQPNPRIEDGAFRPRSRAASASIVNQGLESRGTDETANTDSIPIRREQPFVNKPANSQPAPAASYSDSEDGYDAGAETDDPQAPYDSSESSDAEDFAPPPPPPPKRHHHHHQHHHRSQQVNDNVESDSDDSSDSGSRFQSYDRHQARNNSQPDPNFDSLPDQPDQSQHAQLPRGTGWQGDGGARNDSSRDLDDGGVTSYSDSSYQDAPSRSSTGPSRRHSVNAGDLDSNADLDTGTDSNLRSSEDEAMESSSVREATTRGKNATDYDSRSARDDQDFDRVDGSFGDRRGRDNDYNSMNSEEEDGRASTRVRAERQNDDRQNDDLPPGEQSDLVSRDASEENGAASQRHTLSDEEQNDLGDSNDLKRPSSSKPDNVALSDEDAENPLNTQETETGFNDKRSDSFSPQERSKDESESSAIDGSSSRALNRARTDADDDDNGTQNAWQDKMEDGSFGEPQSRDAGGSMSDNDIDDQFASQSRFGRPPVSDDNDDNLQGGQTRRGSERDDGDYLGGAQDDAASTTRKGDDYNSFSGRGSDSYDDFESGGRGGSNNVLDDDAGIGRSGDSARGDNFRDNQMNDSGSDDGYGANSGRSTGRDRNDDQPFDDGFGAGSRRDNLGDDGGFTNSASFDNAGSRDDYGGVNRSNQDNFDDYGNSNGFDNNNMNDDYRGGNRRTQDDFGDYGGSGSFDRGGNDDFRNNSFGNDNYRNDDYGSRDWDNDGYGSGGNGDGDGRYDRDPYDDDRYNRGSNDNYRYDRDPYVDERNDWDSDDGWNRSRNRRNREDEDGYYEQDGLHGQMSRGRHEERPDAEEKVIYMAALEKARRTLKTKDVVKALESLRELRAVQGNHTWTTLPYPEDFEMDPKEYLELLQELDWDFDQDADRINELRRQAGIPVSDGWTTHHHTHEHGHAKELTVEEAEQAVEIARDHLFAEEAALRQARTPNAVRHAKAGVRDAEKALQEAEGQLKLAHEREGLIASGDYLPPGVEYHSGTRYHQENPEHTDAAAKHEEANEKVADARNRLRQAEASGSHRQIDRAKKELVKAEAARHRALEHLVRTAPADSDHVKAALHREKEDRLKSLQEKDVSQMTPEEFEQHQKALHDSHNEHLESQRQRMDDARQHLNELHDASLRNPDDYGLKRQADAAQAHFDREHEKWQHAAQLKLAEVHQDAATHLEPHERLKKLESIDARHFPPGRIMDHHVKLDHAHHQAVNHRSQQLKHAQEQLQEARAAAERDPDDADAQYRLHQARAVFHHRRVAHRDAHDNMKRHAEEHLRDLQQVDPRELSHDERERHWHQLREAHASRAQMQHEAVVHAEEDMKLAEREHRENGTHDAAAWEHLQATRERHAASVASRDAARAQDREEHKLAKQHLRQLESVQVDQLSDAERQDHRHALHEAQAHEVDLRERRMEHAHRNVEHARLKLERDPENREAQERLADAERRLHRKQRKVLHARHLHAQSAVELHREGSVEHRLAIEHARKTQADIESHDREHEHITGHHHKSVPHSRLDSHHPKHQALSDEEHSQAPSEDLLAAPAHHLDKSPQQSEAFKPHHDAHLEDYSHQQHHQHHQHLRTDHHHPDDGATQHDSSLSDAETAASERRAHETLHVSRPVKPKRSDLAEESQHRLKASMKAHQSFEEAQTHHERHRTQDSQTRLDHARDKRDLANARARETRDKTVHLHDKQDLKRAEKYLHEKKSVLDAARARMHDAEREHGHDSEEHQKAQAAFESARKDHKEARGEHHHLHQRVHDNHTALISHLERQLEARRRSHRLHLDQNGGHDQGASEHAEAARQEARAIAELHTKIQQRRNKQRTLKETGEIQANPFAARRQSHSFSSLQLAAIEERRARHDTKHRRLESDLQKADRQLKEAQSHHDQHQTVESQSLTDARSDYHVKQTRLTQAQVDLDQLQGHSEDSPRRKAAQEAVTHARREADEAWTEAQAAQIAHEERQLEIHRALHRHHVTQNGGHSHGDSQDAQHARKHAEEIDRLEEKLQKRHTQQSKLADEASAEQDVSGSPASKKAIDEARGEVARAKGQLEDSEHRIEHEQRKHHFRQSRRDLDAKSRAVDEAAKQEQHAKDQHGEGSEQHKKAQRHHAEARESHDKAHREHQDAGHHLSRSYTTLMEHRRTRLKDGHLDGKGQAKLANQEVKHSRLREHLDLFHKKHHGEQPGPHHPDSNHSHSVQHENSHDIAEHGTHAHKSDHHEAKPKAPSDVGPSLSDNEADEEHRHPNDLHIEAFEPKTLKPKKTFEERRKQLQERHSHHKAAADAADEEYKQKLAAHKKHKSAQSKADLKRASTHRDKARHDLKTTLLKQKHARLKHGHHKSHERLDSSAEKLEAARQQLREVEADHGRFSSEMELTTARHAFEAAQQEHTNAKTHPQHHQGSGDGDHHSARAKHHEGHINELRNKIEKHKAKLDKTHHQAEAHNKFQSTDEAKKQSEADKEAKREKRRAYRKRKSEKKAAQRLQSNHEGEHHHNDNAFWPRGRKKQAKEEQRVAQVKKERHDRKEAKRKAKEAKRAAWQKKKDSEHVKTEEHKQAERHKREADKRLRKQRKAAERRKRRDEEAKDKALHDRLKAERKAKQKIKEEQEKEAKKRRRELKAAEKKRERDRRKRLRSAEAKAKAAAKRARKKRH
ncbi:hypothetical protein OIO90_002299 [Microbotryomycetes sp. JL221]|nr:hypothetical protein OIO90_002299 [Microbotryomycetes sp. JL221]